MRTFFDRGLIWGFDTTSFSPPFPLLIIPSPSRLSQTSSDGRSVRRGLTPHPLLLDTFPFLKLWLGAFLSTRRCARAIGRVPAPSSGTTFVRPALLLAISDEPRLGGLRGDSLGRVAAPHWLASLSGSLIGRSTHGRCLRQKIALGESPHL